MSVYQKALDDPWLRMDIFGGFDWLQVLNLPASSYDKYQGCAIIAGHPVLMLKLKIKFQTNQSRVRRRWRN